MLFFIILYVLGMYLNLSTLVFVHASPYLGNGVHAHKGQWRIFLHFFSF